MYTAGWCQAAERRVGLPRAVAGTDGLPHRAAAEAGVHRGHRCHNVAPPCSAAITEGPQLRRGCAICHQIRAWNYPFSFKMNMISTFTLPCAGGVRCAAGQAGRRAQGAGVQAAAVTPGGRDGPAALLALQRHPLLNGRPLLPSRASCAKMTHAARQQRSVQRH
jgi:hypothetical protein